MNPGQLLNLVAGLIFVAVGAGVFVLRPRNKAAVSFAALAIGAGAFYALFQPFQPPAFGVHAAVVWGAALLWILGIVGVVALLPKPITRDDWLWVLVTATVGIPLSILYVDQLDRLGFFDGYPGAPSTYTVVMKVILFLLDTAFVFASVAFPWRARRLAPNDAAGARTLAILAVGFTLFSAATVYSIRNPGPLPLLLPVLDMLFVILPPSLWLVATRGHHGRTARNVVLAQVAITLVALLLASNDRNLSYAIGRVLGVLLLGYAVLRGEIAGLDVKMRFAISKSTVAAVFIAVFFVASEVAQEFFGNQLGGPYIGILAAGGLVFAIAPLSRMADRFAEKAVPVASMPAGTPSRREETVYREAVVLAFKDRRFDAGEELALARLADRLGIGAERAIHIRHEVEREKGVR